MISSCPNYLHADVSDGEDLSHHQEEVTDGQLVTMSLVPGTVDSDVISECHLCCLPPPSFFVDPCVSANDEVEHVKKLNIQYISKQD